MGIRARSGEPITLYRYGREWTSNAPGLGDYATGADEKAEYVRADLHRGAVDLLREVEDELERIVMSKRTGLVSAARVRVLWERVHDARGGQYEASPAHPRQRASTNREETNDGR